MKVSGAQRLAAAKHLLQDQINQKKAESLMKESYKLIEALRKEVTGQETTFKIAFDVGGAKRGQVYELALSMSEVLDLTHLSFVSSSKATSAASTMKLRFQKFKAADKLALYNKYLPQLDTDKFKNISQEYQAFQRQTDQFGLTLKPGRQYEFFKKAQAQARYDRSSLAALKTNVSGDQLSFVKGVDFAYQDNSGYHFESLKSFIGQSPSLASFTTLLSTLQSVSTAVQQLVNNPEVLNQYMEYQLQQNESGISEAAEKSIADAVESQVVKPMLDQIFPQTGLADIFNLSST